MNKKILTITLITLTLVSGGFYFWNNKYDQEIVIQEQEELINNEVDTSDWQEYQNDRYSYSFAIPPGYISKAVYEDVVVSLEPNLFGVNLIKDNSSIRVEIEESSIFPGQGNLNERFTKTTQQSGFKLRNFNGIIFFENDNLENSKLFSTIIGDRVLSFKFANVDEDTMKAVLASFKFNQAYSLDTSDWKIYHNEELGIEFKYPEDWYFEDCSQQSSHRVNIFLDDNAIDCGVSMGGRINLVSYNKNASHFYEHYKDYSNAYYDIDYINISGQELMQVAGAYEMVGGEEEEIESKPMVKFIFTYIPFGDEDIIFSYSELFKVKESIDNNGFVVENDYSNIYNAMISSVHFVD